MKKIITAFLVSLFLVQAFAAGSAYSIVAEASAASSVVGVSDGNPTGKIRWKTKRKPFSQSGATVQGTKSETVPKTKPVKKHARYEEATFIATAYYSPLPNQNYYLRNSHREEVSLNGKGEYGASGKPVFIGMIAAPKSYGFGTKIWVEGFGVGSVEDRGGAIVTTGVRGNEHDRIDIWMGYGEEGLARALAWGRRTVSARVYFSEEIAVTFDFSIVKPANLASSIAKPVKKTPTYAGSGTKDSVWISSGSDSEPDELDELDRKIKAFESERLRVKKIVDAMGIPKTGDVGPQIRELQELLIELGYLKTKSTAIYGPSTKAAVAAFQQSAGLIVRSDDPNAGVLGALTREKLVDEILYRGVEI